MESLVDFVPKLEGRQIFILAGWFTLSIVSSIPASFFAKGVTKLATLITKVTGGSNEGHLRIGGSKLGFDIEKPTLTNLITMTLVILTAQVLYNLARGYFPNCIK